MKIIILSIINLKKNIFINLINQNNILNGYMSHVKNNIILMGDLNVILDEDMDLAKYYNDIRFAGNTLEERDAMSKLIKNNKLTDTFRHFNKFVRAYTYFSYRLPNLRKENIGMRLDYG